MDLAIVLVISLLVCPDTSERLSPNTHRDTTTERTISMQRYR